MRRDHGARRRSTLLASLVGGAVLVLALAQLLLPRIAASRISSRVGRYGTVVSVSVSAWPAVELLWGHAQSVSIHARSLALSPGQVAGLLWEARGVARVDMTAESVQLGSLRLEHASLHKRGSALGAAADVSEADVHAALPPGMHVQLLRSGGGNVEVRAGGALFGVSASVDALARARAGKLVAHPLGFLVQALQLTLFADPHVYVTGVGASAAATRPPSYHLTMTARLH